MQRALKIQRNLWNREWAQAWLGKIRAFKQNKGTLRITWEIIGIFKNLKINLWERYCDFKSKSWVFVVTIIWSESAAWWDVKSSSCVDECV